MGRAYDRERAPEDERTAPPATWARRLLRGEASAVREVRKRVRRILSHKRLAVPAQEREDLEQEIMTEVWQAVNRSRFDFSGGFWGFVEVVTSRRCIDWLRARKETLDLLTGTECPGVGPLRKTLARERAEMASDVLSALDPACREIITLRWWDDLSYAEISKAMGKSEGALRVQLHRCVRRARALWRRAVEGRGPRSGEGGLS